MISLKFFIDDYHANKVSIKSLFIVLFYRFSSFFAQNSNVFIRLLGVPIRILYKLLIEVAMGIEMPDKVIAGSALKIFHGMGLVINAQTIFGSNVTLRQNTTIGHKLSDEGCPLIGNNVDIGANVVIIGNIEIGDNATIGAGSVVVKSCPPNSILVGNPAQIIKIKE